MNVTSTELRALALEDAQPEHFEPAQGAAFELVPTDIPGVEPLPLVLLEVRRLPKHGGRREDPFTLFFGGPALPAGLPPVLYDLRGGGVQLSSVFLSRVSVLSNAQAGVAPSDAYYEAVFA